MTMIIVDAHSHLWLRQDTVVDGQRISPLPNGRAMFFGEERQMLPPFMIDGRNSAEVFLSNMDYAQVSVAVVVQEVIDGNQNVYLQEVQRRWPSRFFCCGMPDMTESPAGQADVLAGMGFRGVALPGHRMHDALDSPEWMDFFHCMEDRGMILDICLADDAEQIAQMERVIRNCPKLKTAIGHFGMVTGEHWMKQILLAEAENVYVEAGGITWLFNSEFYPYPSAVKAIREAADAVGMDKLMWGSDYPRTITAITYRMSYDFIQKTQELSEEEKRMLLGENAVKFYGLENLEEIPYVKNMSE
ncbi:MAG: amidohydrolase [Bacteroidaceae bacterium]|nr:amidohydrolase [Bacteroidaceae bacterium]